MPVLYFFESIRCSFLDAFFSVVTLFGEETALLAFGLVIFWCVSKYRGYYLLTVGFVGIVINQTLKMICRVPRPWIKDPNFTIVESAREAATGYSFPSGHTTDATVLFGGPVIRGKLPKILNIQAGHTKRVHSLLFHFQHLFQSINF